MINIKNKGFTLIELLVVITIIGILATGATAVYTSQIQKSRDATRLTSMKALQGALEQAFGDLSYYPGVVSGATPTCTQTSHNASNIRCVVSLGYLSALPKDPKAGQSGNGSALDYTYAVGPLSGVIKQIYELSMGVESDGEKTKCGSGVDSGNDDNRYEMGMTSKGINTRTNANTAIPAGPLNTAMSNSTNNAITTLTSCRMADNNPAGNGDTSTNQSAVIGIRGNCQ